MQFQVMGNVMQAVIVHLQQGEDVGAEAGAMLFMTDAIRMDTQMQGGLGGTIGDLGRMFGGND